MRFAVKKQTRQWVVRVGLVAALATARAGAAEWQAALAAPAERSWYGPRDPLVVTLTDIPAELTEQLRLELDAFDVTDMADVQAGHIRYTPVEPLAPGEHELRLVEYTDTGDIIERGLWAFEVRHSARFRELAFSPGAEVAVQGRVSDANLSPRPDEGVVQASLRIEGAAAGDRHRLALRSNLVHDSSLPADRTQLYELLVSGGDSAGRFALQAGQHEVEGTSLVRQDFVRRGLSGAVALGPARIGAYVQRTDTQAGVRDPFGLNDGDRLTRGLAAQVSPWRHDPGRLVLRGEWLRSTGAEEGVAEQGDGGAPGKGPGGDAWMLAADSTLFSGRLRLYGEYARSRYDHDGRDTGFGAVSDDAFQLFAQYRPVSAGTLDWNAGVQFQQVGTFFRSLANAALPNDKRMLSGTLQATLGGASAGLVLGLERDNVNGLAAFPTIESRVAQLELAWSPQGGPDGPLAQVFGNPGYQLSYAWIDNRQVADGDGFSGDPTDNASQDLYLSAGFSPGPWNWSVDYRHNRFDDDTGLLSDTRNDLVGLNLSVPVRDWLSVAPMLQVGRNRDIDTGITQRDLTAGVSLGLTLNRLGGSLQYSHTRYRASDDSLDSRTKTLGLMLAYRLVEARERRPGLELFMNANWSDSADIGFAPPPTRQIYLGVRSGVAAGGGY